MRRGHGSTKVPNVKLRPAATGTSKSRSLTSRTPSSLIDGNDIDPVEIIRSSKKPFSGLILCASGISDKVTLFQQAVQLGAQTMIHLTDQVTHLICCGPGSEKYTCSVKCRIPIMLPSWVHDSYVRWLAGEDIDMKATIKQHRLPVFTSVSLCITGFEDIQKRQEIQKLVTDNGGEIAQSLDWSITHLVCGPDRGEDGRGTTKMQHVQKLNSEKKANIRMVWEEWVWDCIESGGQASEVDYNAMNPRPVKRRRHADAPLASVPREEVSPNRRRGIPLSVQSSTILGNADAEEEASIKRLPGATDQLWQGVLKNRGFELKNGTIAKNAASVPDVESSTQASNKQKTERTEKSSAAQSSLSTAFQRSKSFAANQEASTSSGAAKHALQRVHSVPAITLSDPSSSKQTISDAPPVSNSSGNESQIPEGERNLFVGLKFRVLGEANCEPVKHAINARGGLVVLESERVVDYIIVRLASGSRLHQEEPSKCERDKYRTECWLEQCVFEERICAPNEHAAFLPLQIMIPIPDAAKLIIHLSGLTPAEKTPSVRLLKAIGATVTEQFSRKNTHLICPSGAGLKCIKAQKWGIPVIGLSWLHAIVKTGVIQDVSGHTIPVIPDSLPDSSFPKQSGGMIDITNGYSTKVSSKGKDYEAQGCLSSQTQPSSEEEAGSMWTMNGLLTEPSDQPLPSTLSSSLHPTSPQKQARTEETTQVNSSLPTVPAEHGSAVTKVPSSSTPSPLKVPKDTMSTSISSESANVLKDAITSLLGKRQSFDDCVSQGQSGKNGKRSKPPPRSKSKQGQFSRTTSSGSLSHTASAPIDYLPITSEDFELASINLDSQEDSMCITYVDPGQQDEKQRLLSLINNEPITAQKKPSKIRRSTRAPGF